MTLAPTIFIVDDDPAYLESISALIESMGWHTKTFPSADAFLSQFDPAAPGCLILDVRMPVMGGLALQETLNKLPLCPSIIVMTGHAEVPTALRAMRQGAADFLQKTFTETELYDAIHRALVKDAATRQKHEREMFLSNLFGQLSTAETDVLRMVLQGETNKKIAAVLDISQRTVEDRRARLMQKLNVTTVADLIRLAIEAGVWKSAQ